MKAIILAAGQGKRLAPLTDNLPKCLLPLDGQTFLEFQVGLLRHCGVDEIVVVTGFCADQVRQVGGPSLQYVHNEDYQTTNSLYSFMLAGDHILQGCLVLNSDVVFEASLLRELLSSNWANALLADFQTELGEEEMKVVCDDDRRIRTLSKDVAPWEANGENLGLVRMGPEGAREVLAEARRADKNGERRLWLPEGVSRTLDRVAFHALPIEGRPWIEVDYRHDLERAQKIIYPLCRLDD